jgi:hypothetical protein
MEWALFEREFGPLTLHERIDAMSAHVSGKPFEWRSTPKVEITDWLTALAKKER